MIPAAPYSTLLIISSWSKIRRSTRKRYVCPEGTRNAPFWKAQKILPVVMAEASTSPPSLSVSIRARFSLPNSSIELLSEDNVVRERLQQRFASSNTESAVLGLSNGVEPTKVGIFKTCCSVAHLRSDLSRLSSRQNLPCSTLLSQPCSVAFRP